MSTPGPAASGITNLCRSDFAASSLFLFCKMKLNVFLIFTGKPKVLLILDQCASDLHSGTLPFLL